MKRQIFLSLLVGTCALTTGCVALWVGAGAALGVGAVAYVRGELESDVDATLLKTYYATIQAMEDLEFRRVGNAKDADTAWVKARTAGDRLVTVRLERVTTGKTHVRIRVETWGDERLSQKVLDHIRARLDQPTVGNE